ncbi:MAG: NUDIX domain-containing protein [Vicinamibacteria bacterium]
MADQVQELLNVYDAEGRVVGSMTRGDAKAQGFAAGAVQLLLVNAHGDVLLQRRREDKENGGLWDKSVGGHVQAGESFDDALVRESNEELFGSATAHKVILVNELANGPSERHPVIARQVRVELGLRDIRYGSSESRSLINVTYHAAMYLGRTLLPISAFAPQQEELADLRFFTPAAIDKMLVSGELAPNMGFFWFALGGLATSRW